jgi:phage shock protein C
VNPRRLYRSRHDRQLAGVAAGMAEYLEVDPTVVRILWILSVFLGGFTIVLYIILAFVVPLDPATAPPSGSWQAGRARGVPPTRADGTEPSSDDAGGLGEAGAASPPDGGTANASWAAPAEWAAPAPDRRPEVRRGGRGSLYLGVVLVVFGAIALANTLLPGWAGVAAMGPAFLVALGVALLVGSARRGAFDR